ncbi:MAG: glycosyltransferase family 2 protein, partial [Elusimicrobia bacterium]|nr:glycosyltransferase family 2 protein [Elusimicrobiota bacterium]
MSKAAAVSRRLPLISCVIPTYNRAAFLSAAIESALGQDFPISEFEIIVVDDGSTDETPWILERFKGKVKVIRQREQGQGETLRTGIRAARGLIIASLDADDVWKPQKL